MSGSPLACRALNLRRLWWATLAPAAVLAATSPNRPNVLFLAADDLRPQLGCYGDPIVKSPHLDALTARGVLFERAYCQQALCSPSRISLLSGRHVWTTKITGIGAALRSTLPDIVTLPQHFKNQGYHTRSLGKVYHMGEHGWWGAKHNNYECATRAPLMIIDPRLKTAGGQTRALVEFVDIYPTLVELCGLPPAPGVEGRSLTPLLRDPSTPWPYTACSEYPIGGYYGTALRTERYRFVEWRDRQGNLAARELYDHQADPAENQNLGARPEHSALLEELSRQLATRRRRPGNP